ncbi:MAG TPA: EamA family transporter [Planctomycetaceae bacterium]|nr:EamA family transporter [Planctomycetaceae bacterium]
MKPDSDHPFPLAAAYGLAVVNALIIGLSFSFVKVAVTLAGPVDTLAFRFLIALAVCIVYARIKGIRPRFDLKNSLRLLPMGACYPLGFFLFQGFGLLYASSGEAGILNATGPIFTAIIAATFIRERYNPVQCFSILLSVVGVIYIAYQKGASLNPDHIAGIALILLSALSGAGYAVLNRTLVRHFTTFEITYYLMIVGAVAFTLASLVQRAVHGTWATVFTPFSDTSFTTAILYLALFSSLLTTVFASLALNRLTSAGLTLFLNLSTIVSILVGYFRLGEAVHAYHLIGAAMILAGLVGTNWFTGSRSRP